MKKFFQTPIGQLRLAGFTEGISFLLLLGIAMPLKYMYDLPLAVKVTGWVHGLLFMLYLLALANVIAVRKWGFKRIFLGVAASLIPFGPFLFDSTLKKEEQAPLS